MLAVSEENWEEVFTALVEWVTFMGDYLEEHEGKAPPSREELAEFLMDLDGVELTEEAFHAIMQSMGDPFNPDNRDALGQALNI